MKYYTDEQKEVRNFIKILIGLILILGILYFITSKVSEGTNKYSKTNNPGTIQYSSIIVGEILNRSDAEYYVLVTDTSNLDNTDIINTVNLYKTKQNKLPLYMVDLSNEFNKPYIGDTSNFTKDSVEDIKFKETTLIKVKNSQITKFIEDVNEMESELK